MRTLRMLCGLAILLALAAPAASQSLQIRPEFSLNQTIALPNPATVPGVTVSLFYAASQTRHTRAGDVVTVIIGPTAVDTLPPVVMNRHEVRSLGPGRYRFLVVLPRDVSGTLAQGGFAALFDVELTATQVTATPIGSTVQFAGGIDPLTLFPDPSGTVPVAAPPIPVLDDRGLLALGLLMLALGAWWQRRKSQWQTLSSD